MGEIGISQESFYGLKWWQVRSIIRGYDRRVETQWSMTRWHTYHVMASMPFTDIRKAKIHKPADLLPLPGDVDHTPITEQDTIDLFADVKAFEKSLKEKSKQ